MQELINQLINKNILKIPLVIEAFRAIDRKDFVQPINLDEAYGNYPLSIGHGQTISQPLTVAFMLELLDPQPGEKILDVGAGSGWQTALLAYVISSKNSGQEKKGKIKNKDFYRGTTRKDPSAGSGQARNYAETTGKIYAIERIPELVEFGKQNVAKYNFIQKNIVEFFCADGSKGLPGEAPFDKIIVAAAAEKVPDALKKQLKIGGRLVLPVGKYDQAIVKIDKAGGDKFKEEKYPGFIFVPLITHG